MRKLFLSLSTLVLMLSACKEEVDTSARYVFSEYTVASYLDSHDEYSQYVQLMKEVPMSDMDGSSTVYQLMSARGNYTCFALTNEAIQNYLSDLVEQELITEPSLESFTQKHTRDSICKVIVRNTIIDGGDLESQRYTISLFPTQQNAEFPLPNINDHKLTYSWDTKNTELAYLDKDCPIDPRNRDIPLTNGVIHQLHKVIAPKDESCARYIQNILDSKREGYLMFSKALQACGLLPILTQVRDEVYEEMYLTNKIPDMKNYQDKGGGDKSATSGDPDAHAPEHRKIGFTLFCETDEFWRSQGIDPTAGDAVEKLQQWIVDNRAFVSDFGYEANTNYTSPKNMLYQWTVYHILPMRIPANKLVYHCNEVGYSTSQAFKYSIPVFEWYPVYGGDRLLKLYESKESEGIYLNRFPILNNGISQDGHEAACNPDKVGCHILTDDPMTVVTDINNACIYPIDAPLAYNESTRDNLSKERIRFDLFALFPEAITNGLRRADSMEGKYQHVYIPQDQIYQYFDHMSILNEETHFIHYNGYRINWANYCQDEDKAFGCFDIMFTLPPVPKRGTYELRYKVLATGARGIVQVYFGSDPKNLPVAGIPIDMTKGVVASFGEDATWAELQDQGREDDEKIDIDHNLRNHGLMKAARHEVHESDASLTARDDSRCCRHIVARQTLEPGRPYYVRFKNVLDSEKKELYLDYFEWCPKEIYDNPSEPEDVW